MKKSLKSGQPILSSSTFCYKYPWILLVIILFLLILSFVIYFIFAELKNVSSSDSRVADEFQEPINQNTFPPSVSMPEILNSQDKGKFYIQVWEEDSSTSILYEVNNGKLQKVFSGLDDRIVGAALDGFLINQQGKLSFYNINTQKSETLFVAELSRFFVGKMDPNYSQYIFVDRCEWVCPENMQQIGNTIKSLDLNTQQITTVYAGNLISRQAYLPQYWVSDDTVVLVPEAYPEGIPHYPKVFTLNISSKELQELSLDPYTISLDAKPSGRGIVFTTFLYDKEKDLYSSALVLKNLDGSTKILQKSSELVYKSAAWIDAKNIVVLSATIQTVTGNLCDTMGLGSCTKDGKSSMQIINIETNDVQTYDLLVDPINIFPNNIIFADNKGLYYTSINIDSLNNSDSEIFYSLHYYNFIEKKDIIVLESPYYTSRAF